VGSFSFLCFGPSRPSPIVGPFEEEEEGSLSYRITCRSGSVHRSDNRPSGLIVFLFWAQVGPGPLSAPFEVWLIVSPSLLLAHYGVWPIVGPFVSAFTSHLPPSLAARQPLSSPTASTIYGPFLASVTAITLVSNFKLKVIEYSTLSLRGMLEYFILYIYCLSY
jgi:hypothetical protein